MKTPKIKNKYFAVSPARYVAKSDTILLLPVSALKEANSLLVNCIPEDQSITQLIDKGVNFYYTIEQFDSCRPDRKMLAFERGIGTLEGKKHRVLRRLFLLENHVEHKKNSGVTPEGFLQFDDNDLIIIGTYLPDKYIDLYLLPFSVVCATESFRPEPVHIEPSSLLGRTDGDIQSINREELGLILGHEHLIASLAKTTAPILVGSSYFELVGKNSILSSDHLILKPSPRRPRNREAGSIIFNNKTKCFEGFDGTKWRPLKWGDE
jgi:hypothetical protein